MDPSAVTGNKHSKSDIGPLASLVYGLQVMAAEAKWLLLSAIRTFEISRLQKRLREEQALIGSLIAAAVRAKDSAAPDVSDSSDGSKACGALDALPCNNAQVTVALRQIDFIHEEITYLERDRENMRQEYYERRKKKLGIA